MRSGVGQENISKDQGSKGGIGDLPESLQNEPKRQPLAVQQNVTINPAAMAFLRDRHLPGLRPMQTVKESENLSQSLPKRQTPPRFESIHGTQEAAPLTQTPSRNPDNLERPMLREGAQRQIETAKDGDQRQSTSPSPPNPRRTSNLPPPCEIAGLETNTVAQSTSLSRSEPASQPQYTASQSRWAELRASLLSTRFLSRSSMRIPPSQEKLLGKDTSYWPPLTGNPLPLKNLPVELLSSITDAVDFPTQSERIEDKKSHGDAENDVQTSLYASRESRLSQEIDGSHSELSEEEEVEWSSSPPRSPRLPPDSSPQSLKEFSQDVLHLRTEPGREGDNADTTRDNAEPLPGESWQRLPAQDMEAPNNECRTQGSPETAQSAKPHHAPGSGEGVSAEKVAPTGSLAISAPSSQPRTSSVPQLNSPTVQILRTPAVNDTSSLGRESLSSNRVTGTEMDTKPLCDKAKSGEQLTSVAEEPQLSIDTTSLSSHKISNDFENNSSEDELPNSSQARMHVDSQSNEDQQNSSIASSRKQAQTIPSVNGSPRSMSARMDVSGTPEKSNSRHSLTHGTSLKSSRNNNSSPIFSSPRSEVSHNFRIEATYQLGNEDKIMMSRGADIHRSSSKPAVLCNADRNPGSQLASSDQDRSNCPSTTPIPVTSPLVPSSSSREDPVVKKRKRPQFDADEEKQDHRSPTYTSSQALDPNGPISRAAQVRAEYFRQQARKLKLVGTVEDDTSTHFDSYRSSGDPQPLIQNRRAFFVEPAIVDSSMRTPLPMQERNAGTSSILPDFRDSEMRRKSSSTSSMKRKDLGGRRRDSRTIEQSWDQAQSIHPDVDSNGAFHNAYSENSSLAISQRKLSHKWTSKSHQSPRLSAGGAGLQPPEAAFREVYKQFRSTYPEYTADITHLFKACRSLRVLRAEGRAPHPSLFDDFVIRRELEYAQYLRAVAAEGDDPIPYAQFFDETEPKYIRRILTAAHLDSLPETCGPVESHKIGFDDNVTLTSSLPFSRPSTSPTSIPERASGEASPEIPYSNMKSPDFGDDDNVEPPPIVEAETTRERKWYHDPNTAFKCWARGMSKRDRPLVDENGVPWRSVASEKVVDIFKRH